MRAKTFSEGKLGAVESHDSMPPVPPHLSNLMLWTPKHLEEIFGVKQGTIKAWRHTGSGPKFVRVNNREIRYRPSDVIEWVAQRVRASGSAAS